MITPMILLLALNLSTPTTATVDTVDTASVDSTQLSHGARFIVLPIIFSSPDTRWAGGVLPQVVFETGQGERSSSIRMDAFYTQNRQFTVRLRPTLWLQHDQYVLGANAAFKKWPTNYYGIYSPANAELKEPYTELFVENSLEAARRVAPQLYVGLRHDYRHSRLRDLTTDGELVRGEIPGSFGGTTSGVGLIVRYDNRNHDFYPSGGGYYQLSMKTAQRFLGSDYRYAAVEIDARRYYSPGGPHAVAGQAVVRLTEGDAPFQLMPGVGSVLRGYSTARYVGADLIALQAEYRVVPLFWRVGLVGFVGAAQIAPTISDFSFNEVKYMIGVGARVQLSRQDAINIRWDFGYGLKSSGDYLDLGEAF
jgi:outer membrane protein assembly factor BamA